MPLAFNYYRILIGSQISQRNGYPGSPSRYRPNFAGVCARTTSISLHPQDLSACKFRVSRMALWYTMSTKMF